MGLEGTLKVFSLNDIFQMLGLQRKTGVLTVESDEDTITISFLGGQVVAYGGIWVILEDSHITTIAVHPDRRGLKLGEEMLIKLLDEAIAQGASWITLEVRESNDVAQKLYRKYGFTTVSTRRGYYSDNGENALVMWAGNLKGELYGARLRALRGALDAEIERR